MVLLTLHPLSALLYRRLFSSSSSAFCHCRWCCSCDIQSGGRKPKPNAKLLSFNLNLCRCFSWRYIVYDVRMENIRMIYLSTVQTPWVIFQPLTYTIVMNNKINSCALKMCSPKPTTQLNTQLNFFVSLLCCVFLFFSLLLSVCYSSFVRSRWCRCFFFLRVSFHLRTHENVDFACAHRARIEQ